MKKKDILLELSLPVVMAALGIFVLIKAESIKPKSAATFPRICAVLMLIGVAVTILQILVTKKKTTHFEGLRVEKALFLLLMILLYTILLPRIGYIIPTLLLCACIGQGAELSETAGDRPVRLHRGRGYFRALQDHSEGSPSDALP